MAGVTKREEGLRARLEADASDQEALVALAELVGRARDRKGEAVELWERYAGLVAPSQVGQALLGLARAQVEARCEDEAIATLERSIAEGAKLFAVYELLGELLRRAGRLEEAAAAFRQANALDAQAVETRLALIACLDALDRSEEAKAEIDALRAIGQDAPAVAALVRELMQRRG